MIGTRTVQGVWVLGLENRALIELWARCRFRPVLNTKWIADILDVFVLSCRMQGIRRQSPMRQSPFNTTERYYRALLPSVTTERYYRALLPSVGPDVSCTVPAGKNTGSCLPLLLILKTLRQLRAVDLDIAIGFIREVDVDVLEAETLG